ncbi:MAG: FHA domain-containing protein [Myxococcales bacterium]|nr:FHA domain-containing protein [Myxococcales bacterium]
MKTAAKKAPLVSRATSSSAVRPVMTAERVVSSTPPQPADVPKPASATGKKIPDDAATTVEMPAVDDAEEPPLAEMKTSEGLTTSATDAAPRFDDDDDDEVRGDELIEHTYLGPKPASVAQRICPSCGALIPGTHKFCGGCGEAYTPPAKVDRSSFPKMSPVEPEGKILAKLVLINPDGTLGEYFAITERTLTVGRSANHPLFQEDSFLDTDHVKLDSEGGKLYATDVGSVNGTFLRLNGEVELEHGDRFRLGQELLLFETIDKLPRLIEPDGADTQVIGSPLAPSVWGRLSQVVSLDYQSNAFLLELNEVVLGREHGNIIFPDDGFVSGRHARVSNRGNRYFLEDLNSSNGTYFLVKERTELQTGDILLLGQQLFQVEVL